MRAEAWIESETAETAFCLKAFGWERKEEAGGQCAVKGGLLMVGEYFECQGNNAAEWEGLVLQEGEGKKEAGPWDGQRELDLYRGTGW